MRQPDNAALDALIRHHHLPASYRMAVKTVIAPLGRWLQRQVHPERPVIVGINGAQGTGKSTLTVFLRHILESHHHCRVAAFSLDDLYLKRASRRELGRRVHPLLCTRGVPGTHDLALGQVTLDALVNATPSSRTRIPRFDKATDEPLPACEWPEFAGRPDLILIEGWCQGALPQAEADLVTPVNELEATADPHGVWRHWVNAKLAGSYQDFFARQDRLLMLKAPSMDCVRMWRLQQEHQLAATSGSAPKSSSAAGHPAPERRILSDADVIRFIMHFERLTRHCLATLPGQADAVLPVDTGHRMTGLHWRSEDTE